MKRHILDSSNEEAGQSVWSRSRGVINQQLGFRAKSKDMVDIPEFDLESSPPGIIRTRSRSLKEN